MHREQKKDAYKDLSRSTLAFFCALLFFVAPHAFAEPFQATTTVTISICGDGILNQGEVCDDGPIGNDGGYGASISARHCLPDCQGYGPYCGDLIVQFLYSEECDDGNNSAGDLCSPQCTNESSPINTTESGGGAGGGSGGRGGLVNGVIPIENPTKVSLSGKAYVGSLVHILKDGKEIATASANGKADFTQQIDTVTAGPATFGFWAEDGKGRRSMTFTTTFQVTESAITTISGIYIPPTIQADNLSVLPGNEITFSGRTIPNADVILYIDGGKDFSEKGTSDASGDWKIAFDTKSLKAETFHTAKAAFSIGTAFTGGSGEAESVFGQTLNFYVGHGEGPETFFADLNVDGKVNIVDFSILLFNWGGTGGDAKPSPDINHDGQVNLTDFSVMIFYWTG